MTFPQISSAARNEALLKANAVRRERQVVLAALKSGKITLEQVFDRDDHPVIARTRVRRVLESLPGVGKVRADRCLDECGIWEKRRVQGLSPRQRTALLSRFPAGSGEASADG
ncbi:integration host factor, actinobacterial type [Streptomyces sp. IBSNAI002]|uniref:integration host factor, actinobacterial type n=1 Tax=Streptomyces sp. IBSNAI002 TaxID=3457500 RepID=UPI003FD364FE